MSRRDRPMRGVGRATAGACGPGEVFLPVKMGGSSHRSPWKCLLAKLEHPGRRTTAPQASGCAGTFKITRDTRRAPGGAGCVRRRARRAPGDRDVEWLHQPVGRRAVCAGDRLVGDDGPALEYKIELATANSTDLIWSAIAMLLDEDAGRGARALGRWCVRSCVPSCRSVREDPGGRSDYEDARLWRGGFLARRGCALRIITSWRCCWRWPPLMPDSVRPAGSAWGVMGELSLAVKVETGTEANEEMGIN